MGDFRVVDVSLDGSRAALRDRTGALHVVRAQRGRLQVHDEFIGAQARPGRQWLLAPDSKRTLTVNFEHVNCCQFLALDRIHDQAIGHRLAEPAAAAAIHREHR